MKSAVAKSFDIVYFSLIQFAYIFTESTVDTSFFDRFQILSSVLVSKNGKFIGR